MFKNNTHRGLGNKGFSLVELIIVVAIMAALIAILAPQYIKYVEKSRVTADETFADELLGAVQILVTDEAVYSALGKTDVTITWADKAVAITTDVAADLDGDGATTTEGESTAIDTLLKQSLGDEYATQEISSNGHKAQTYTIKIDMSAGAPQVGGSWADTPTE